MHCIGKMSYDIHLVRRGSFACYLEWESTLQNEAQEINPGLPNLAKEQQKERLAALLRETNPVLEPFEFGFAAIAESQGISEEEARIRWRHIELNGPDDGNGIQITLYDDTADITVPYWHQDDAATVVFEEIWRYLHIFETSGQFLAADPQLQRFLDLSIDQPAVVARYTAVVAKMPEIIADIESRPKPKPWWKFW